MLKASKEELIKARDEAYKLATSRYESENPNHSKYSSIYLASTANVKDTLAIYDNYKSVLTVGGTGAHGFEAALNGAKKVDMFDINVLQRIYYELLYTAIIYLDYEEFIKYFTLQEQKEVFQKDEISNLISNEMYEKLVCFLPEDARFVLEPLFETFFSFDLILSGLYRFQYSIDINYLKKYISFYNKESYQKLQNILRKGDCEFNYYCVSLIDVPSYFKDKYDLVLLDNILQYYQDISLLDTPYNVNQFIQEKLIERVNDGGAIQVNYGFEVASDAFAKKFNLSLADNPNCNSIFSNFIRQKEMKEGINICLYEKWDGYEYNFIPGVEKPRDKTQNMVLTLRKDKCRRR